MAMFDIYVVGSKNSGTPKWMVKIMENPIKMDELGGKPPIFGNTHVQFQGINKNFDLGGLFPLPRM